MSPELVRSHESGHAIAAWKSGSVERVTRAYAREFHGAVEIKMKERVLVPTQDIWAATVICLAGIAAQFYSGHKVRARGAAEDLTQALELAQKIALRVEPLEAFPVDTENRQSITRMLSCEMSRPVRHVIEAAYLKAQALVRSYSIEQRVLTLALGVVDELDETDLRLVLGERPAKGFVRPSGSRVRRWLRAYAGLLAVVMRRVRKSGER